MGSAIKFKTSEDNKNDESDIVMDITDSSFSKGLGIAICLINQKSVATAVYTLILILFSSYNATQSSLIVFVNQFLFIHKNVSNF